MESFSSDIVIVGGGIAGCATGIALKRLLPELDVCLLDRGRDASGNVNRINDAYADFIRPRIGETLPPQIVIPLQQLGIWERFSSQPFIRCAGTQAVWGENAPHFNEYIYTPFGSGWHLDRAQFDAFMLDTAKQQDVRVLHQTQFVSISKDNDRWLLDLRTTLPCEHEPESITLQAKFAVDASGRSARLARRLGATKQTFDRLLGIYRFYQQDDHRSHITSSDSTTLIESTEQGWWYCSGLPRHNAVAALMTDADLAHSQAYRQSARFNQALESTQLIANRVDGLSASGTPLVAAAHTQCLDQCAGTGWLAVGDAAFTYDPLSSLGIFKALRMSSYASYAINDFFNGKDRNLDKYQWLARAEFKVYLAKRREYYAQETRFSNKPFWQRRLAA